jgi:peptidoglycan/LPS O-acetylase OafA/YrhL
VSSSPSRSHPEPQPSGPPTARVDRHLPALDGVRAVASTAVLLTHVGFATGAVGPTLLGAMIARLDVGVPLFFALSGFLMLRPWVRTAVEGRERRIPPVGEYAMSRAARILPAYWVVTILVLLVEAARVYGDTLLSPLRVDPGTVLTHLVIGQGLSGDTFTSFSQTWSLTTEVTFYVAVPLLGLALLRICRSWPGTDGPERARRILGIERWCVGVMALGIGVAVFSASDLPGASGTLATSLLGHCAWFAAGVWTFARTQRTGTGTRSAWTADQLFALAGALLVLAASPVGGSLLFEQPSPLQAGAKEGLFTLIALLVVSAAASPSIGDSAVGRLLSSAPLTWLGTRSYALFLCHLPILFGILTVLRLDLFEGSFLPVAVVTFVVSVAAADLSWRFVERPVLDRVRRRRERQQD